jgi:hypothetical protein
MMISSAGKIRNSFQCGRNFWMRLVLSKMPIAIGLDEIQGSDTMCSVILQYHEPCFFILDGLFHD